MPSFAEQLEAARTAHLAASSLEASVREQIATIFEEWQNGVHSNRSIRHRMENVVRNAYRTSAALAAAHTARMSGIPDWTPQGEIFNTDYLQSLLKDVRRNLREYNKSDQDDAARRRHVLRMQHSAGVGAQRGYTDALIASYSELEDFGYQIHKIWLANFVNNTPCPTCRALHGTKVGLHETFPVPSGTPNVYINLLGPPRHPRCQCYLALLTVSLENVFEELDIESPDEDPPEEMDTDDVKDLPWGIFSAIVGALRKLIQFVTGA